MTVRQLIEKLKEMPKDIDVIVYIPFTEEEQEIQNVYMELNEIVKIEIDY